MSRSVRVFETGTNTPHEGGFTLIELMFALVYLAIGLLGVAAMQNIALSKNVDGRRMSIATNLATEMIERVRFNGPANAKVGLAGAVAPFYPYNGIRVCAVAGCPGGVSQGNAGNNPTALGDYNQWQAHLQATDGNGVVLLPQAVGTVTSQATGPASLEQVQVTVTVQWNSGVRTPTITMSTIVSRY
jgi:type IV pilus assembly protein PilV